MTKEEFQATDPNKLLALINVREELLEALKAARAYIPSLYQEAHGRAWPANSALRKQLDDAIAKAEGSNSTKETLR
jgi:hypothetical protein